MRSLSLSIQHLLLLLLLSVVVLAASPPHLPLAAPTGDTYLVRALPLPLPGPDTMGLAYNTYLSSPKIYGCKNCKTHLSNHEDIISRSFRGQHGKAYLFGNVVNVTMSEPKERNMTTGRHIVRDIACRQCNETVGWKYDKAYEAAEKYKEGRFILEVELLSTVN